MTCSASANLFVAGIVIFTAASVLSGLAQDPTQLILARAAQGLGAAVLAHQGLPIMLSVFPVERRGGVFAVYGILAGLAVVAGPTLGGFLVTHFGWRLVFASSSATSVGPLPANGPVHGRGYGRIPASGPSWRSGSRSRDPSP